MRMLLVTAFLVASGSFAAAQTPPPAPAPTSSQQDAARKAWISHAIEHILGGTGERTERGNALPTVFN